MTQDEIGAQLDACVSAEERETLVLSLIQQDIAVPLVLFAIAYAFTLDRTFSRTHWFNSYVTHKDVLPWVGYANAADADDAKELETWEAYKAAHMRC